MAPDEGIDPFASLIEAAASPFAGTEGCDLLEALTIESCRQAVRAFVKNVSSRVDLPTPLITVLSNFSERITKFEDAWDPVLGAIYHAQRNQDALFLSRVSVELAIRAHTAGEAGSWHLEFPFPTSIPLATSLIDDVSALTAEADGQATWLEIVTQTGSIQRVLVGSDGQSWHTGIREPTLANFAYRTREDYSASPAPVEPEMVNALAGGIYLLDTTSPLYAEWVRRVVRQVAPIQCHGTQVSSWSSLHYPGLVSLTLFDSPLDMAETLVHEASHQRYHMLDRCLPMIRLGAAETLAWSPIKQCHRPLPMILLAFHAFGNIALFFRDVRASGALDHAGFRYHMSDLCAWLPAMAETLGCSRALTCDGDRFWRDLYARVAPVLSEAEAITA